MDPSRSNQTLPDGVYFGFNVSNVNGKSIPHPWMEVIDKGRSRTFEYGPESDRLGGLFSPMVEKNQVYKDDHANAGALFAISPPAGMSPEKFIERALALGNNMNGVLKSEYIPYVPGLVADCDSAALALFQDLGGSTLQFEQMTMSVTAGTALDHAFTDAGGLSFGPTEVALAVQLWHTLPFPSVVGIPHPDAGTIGMKQLNVNSHDLAPAPSSGAAPPTGDQHSPVGLQTPSVNGDRTAAGLSRETAHGQASDTRDTTARRQSTGVAPAANAIESRAVSEPTSHAPLKATEMTSEQIGLYVDIGKDARAVFAEALGKWAPTVSVESNGVTWDREFFSNTGKIVGLEDGKLIAQSAWGQKTTFDYGDLLMSSKDPVAFDAMARHALAAGEPMNLSMQHGQASLIAQPAHERQQTVQRDRGELSLER